MRRSRFLVVFILFIWFVISFVTNILGPIMPVIIDNYNLNLTMAAFLPFSFFLAYGLVSIPAGALVEHIGEKKSMLIAFTLTFAGSFLFAVYPTYLIALGSLFIIGVGMAMLQVVINPLMREAGGEEHFAFFSVMGQLIFGAASFVSPLVFSYFMQNLRNYAGEGGFLLDGLSKVVPDGLPWNSMYWLFTLIFILMLIIIAFVRIPQVELKDEERPGAIKTYLELFKDRRVILFFLGIMAYVGTEQGMANWMSKFLETYHGVDPATTGAQAISRFWGLMTLGCVLGLVVLKLLDSKLVLKIFTVLTILTLILALFGNKTMSLIAFPFCGFFIAVMYSIIFSLALNSVREHHGAFSGILCSGIFGGALVPLIIGWLGDFMGLKAAMTFLFITLAYIMSIAFWANPLTDNKTVSLKNLLKSIRRRTADSKG